MTPLKRSAPDGAEEDLRAILRAGLAAVDPARRVAEALAEDPDLVRWAGELARAETAPVGAAPRGRTVLVAVGKAALGMTRGAVGVLGSRIDEGIVLVPHAPDATPPGSGRTRRERDPDASPGEPRPGPRRPPWLPGAIELRAGGHPVPDAAGEDAARRIVALACGLGTGDRMLALVSGGGSALLSLPAEGLTLEDLRATTSALLAAGLPIEEINAVRAHLERLKGGGLARHAAPASVLGLVLSDVPGDPPAVVASGPLSPDPRTFRDVEILLRRRGLWDVLPGPVRAYLAEGRRGRLPETPAPGEAIFREVRVRVVAGGRSAVEGAATEARRRGYTTHVLSSELRGEARRAGRGLARVGMAVRDGLGPVGSPACLLAAGETTVRVVGSGRGGRNQEVALAAALVLQGVDGVRVAALGTDGVDGPTDAAGAWVDGQTIARGRAEGLDPDEALEQNDAYPFLEAAGALLRTGPTGTNVADLMVVLVADTPAPE